MTIRKNKAARAGGISTSVFATVPGQRVAQQSDCRSSCCRTPFTCAQRYRCACHQGVAQ